MRGSNVRSIAVTAVAAASLAGLILVGCQSYELDPVQPKAIAAVNEPIPVQGRSLPPKVMIVVDKSGSMLESADGTGFPCSDDGTISGNYVRNKPCKWNDLLEAFVTGTDGAEGFLRANANAASEWGLIAFPTGEECGTGTVIEDLGENNIEKVITGLNNISPIGGTPSATTLLEVLKNPKMTTHEPGRERVVMFLTDGLPTCNTANANRCDQCLASGTCLDANDPSGCFAQWDDCHFPDFGHGCLDETGLEDAIKQLRDAGILTFVIGFGKDTGTGVANRVLNRAAEAGGLARNDSAIRYYQANNRQELQQALEDFIKVTQSCDFTLDPLPTNEKVVTVVLVDKVDGGKEYVLERGKDWEFIAGNVGDLKLLENKCAELRAAEPERYELSFRYASNL